MNSAMNVEAYKSFYSQGMDAYDSGDLEKAKTLLLRAAEIANDISTTTNSYNVKMEYHNIALKILDFVKNKCKKATINTTNESAKETESTTKFEPTVNEEKITFVDVAGLEDVKDEIEFKVLNPLKNPELAKKYKINAGGKILLYGPPGTGKTFIARAIAGEVDAVFYAINCQDLISKYMGDSSKQLDTLFETALKNERAIIFFDEFDSIASKRESDSGGVDAEMSRFVATFLTKVDGFKKSKTNKMLLLIAATNRPWALDNAMIRGGRFDTHVYVGVPDEEARRFLINKSFKDVPVAEDFDIESITEKLNGFGGGDIMAICEKIRLIAYKKSIKSGKEEKISNEDCLKVISNQRNVITQEELDRFQKFHLGEEL